jgi:DNA mismatch endonuclease, patch repair protein
MSDVFSAEKRSQIMSRVRDRDNRATELAMMSTLRRNRITGWRRHPSLFGNPDFVFSKQRVAMFVDGCFWHCCPHHGTHPTSNMTFWNEKLGRNKRRDQVVNRTLKERGWRVVRIWQHELSPRYEKKLIRRIERALSWLV